MHDASSWLHATSSEQSVIAAQHDVPRHASHAPWAAIPVQAAAAAGRCRRRRRVQSTAARTSRRARALGEAGAGVEVGDRDARAGAAARRPGRAAGRAERRANPGRALGVGREAQAHEALAVLGLAAGPPNAPPPPLEPPSGASPPAWLPPLELDPQADESPEPRTLPRRPRPGSDGDSCVEITPALERGDGLLRSKPPAKL